MEHGKKGIVFIGLGLNDETDITLKGLEALESCDTVFSEFYTASLMGSTVERLEKRFGKKITVLTREDVESGDVIIERARNEKIAFLTAGDPMAATTHTELRIRCWKEGIPTEIVHGISVLVAAPSILGLQHYKFGRTTTIPFVERGYFPTSPYKNIIANFDMGLHTLALLDIHAHENRYMTVGEALKIMLAMEEKEGSDFFGKHPLVCGLARIGSRDMTVRCGRIEDLLEHDFGPPLHCIVIPAKMHFMEKEALHLFAGAPEELLDLY